MTDAHGDSQRSDLQAGPGSEDASSARDSSVSTHVRSLLAQADEVRAHDRTAAAALNEEALAEAHASGDAGVLADATLGLSAARHALDDVPEATRLAEEALAWYRAALHAPGQAASLLMLSRLRTRAGQDDQSAALAEQALRLLDSPDQNADGTASVTADALTLLAGSLRRLGRPEEALDASERACRALLEERTVLRRQARQRHDEIERLTRERDALTREVSWYADELARQVRMDGLTGLLNRRAFLDRFEEEFARVRRAPAPLSVALFEVDFLGGINETFTHAVGDDVLRRVAHLLRLSVREMDVTARYGGEKFALMLPNTDLMGAVITCERIRRVVQDDNWSALHPDLNVTVSVGVCGEANLDRPERWVSVADEHLRRAVRAGRNQVSA